MQHGIGEAIKNARMDKNMSATELCRMAKIPKSSLSDWENGKSQPSAKSFLKILECLGMTASKLMQYRTDLDIKLPKTKIPVFDRISDNAESNALSYEDISEDMAKSGDFFALKVKDNSMFPVFNENDTVIVKKQSDAESGKICVLLIDGKSTIKEIKKESNGLWVLPKNPYSEFKATFFSNEDASVCVKIIGVAVEIRRSL